MGNSPIDTLLDLLYPNFHVNLSLSLSIVIPRKVLLPMTVDGVIPPEETEKVVLTFDPGEFNFTSSGSVGFSESVQVSFPSQYPKAQIGKTGLTLWELGQTNQTGLTSRLKKTYGHLGGR